MKRVISVISVVGAAAAAFLGAVLLNGAGFWFASGVSALLCCVPFFLSFEKRLPSAGELVLVAVMTAFSAAGRWIFAPLPFFKPVAAIVIISGRHFGAQAGFMTGALSALISNFWFGQGPWTPFQMLGWGLIGAAAGLCAGRGLLDKPLSLCVFGVLAGIAYSFVMDVWTVLSMNGSFAPGLWITAAVSALPVTGVYCASNLLFLIILSKPLGKNLERLKTKYGVFQPEQTHNKERT